MKHLPQTQYYINKESQNIQNLKNLSYVSQRLQEFGLPMNGVCKQPIYLYELKKYCLETTPAHC